MGKRGPSKTPSAILKKRGSRKLEHRGKEPVPPSGMPEPPDFLDGPALDLWHEHAGRLHGMGVLSSLDRYTFGIMCDSLAEFLDKKTKTPYDRFYRLAKEFGLTPSSRAELSVEQPQQSEGKERFFKLSG